MTAEKPMTTSPHDSRIIALSHVDFDLFYLKKERKKEKKNHHWSLGEITCKGRVFLQKHYCTVFRNMDFRVKED